MSMERRDELVEHPTFLEHVRYFFDPVDINHMRRVAQMDLASYEGVKAKATQIYFQTSSGQMPPAAERRWPETRVRTFRNWIVDRFPMGESKFEPRGQELMEAGAGAGIAQPKRRNAANMDPAAVARLKEAFAALMARDPNDPQSYFAIAGIHWFPTPTYCVHREHRYNPWHRVYVDRFEAALRSIPGFDDLRLPYWDILAPIPEWLFEPPFDSYVLQTAAAPEFGAGFRTLRFDRDAIHQSLAEFDVAGTIKQAMNSPTWERFTERVEQAHNDGHVSVGPAVGGLGRPDVASFDPIFWFFHCNWERLWWAWQGRYRATQLAGFRTTLEFPSDVDWLDTPPFNALEPFDKTADQTIDSSGMPTRMRARSCLSPRHPSSPAACRSKAPSASPARLALRFASTASLVSASRAASLFTSWRMDRRLLATQCFSRASPSNAPVVSPARKSPLSSASDATQSPASVLRSPSRILGRTASGAGYRSQESVHHGLKCGNC